MVQFQFHVESPGELGAGIRPFSEDVTVSLENTRDSEIDSAEFIEHFRETLRYWFDTPTVYTKAEFDAILAKLDAQEQELLRQGE